MRSGIGWEGSVGGQVWPKNVLCGRSRAKVLRREVIVERRAPLSTPNQKGLRAAIASSEFEARSSTLGYQRLAVGDVLVLPSTIARMATRSRSG